MDESEDGEVCCLKDLENTHTPVLAITEATGVLIGHRKGSDTMGRSIASLSEEEIK